MRPPQLVSGCGDRHRRARKKTDARASGARGRLWPLLLAVCLLCAAGGCAGGNAARDELPPDQRYGHRYEQADAEGRRTLTLTDVSPAPPRHEAPVEEVIVRAAPFEPGADDVPVELLIKGGLPNSCLVLSETEQDRNGHFLAVTFTMAWPKAGGCERYERPYRFYLPLEGRYEPGDYTLKLNGTPYPFTVRRRG